jgi:hypothetical protein
MPAKVSQRQLHEALVDVDYPADKQQLLRHAERNRADEQVRSALRARERHRARVAEHLREIDEAGGGEG